MQAGLGVANLRSMHTNPEDTAVAANEIIDALGGTAEVARLCRVKPPSVSEWRKAGIPPARRQYLELLRPDVFRAGEVG